MAPAHLIQWRQGIGSFVVEGTALSPDGKSFCFHSTFFFIVCKHPHSNGKPALLAHPLLPVAQETWLAEPGMQCPAFRRLGEGQKQGQGAAPSISLRPGLHERHRGETVQLLLSHPSNQSHMHTSTASLWHFLYNSNVWQQRGQEDKIQARQWAGGGSPTALWHLGAGQPARERGWRGTGSTQAGTDLPVY